jgi:phosphonate transport system permease protein
LALGLNTAGFLGKFYAEAIENVDPKPVEAVEAAGARFFQRIGHSIFPQVSPLFNSYNLYILERNIRYSTIMGLVGAGGIGFELVMTSRMFEYRQEAAMLLIIVATIMIVDRLSAFIRKRVV